jgi:C_GCAxxG_C_C family probable redox protein
MSEDSISTQLFISSGFNCAQAVLSSHCEEFGLDRELAFKLACGFGGGMGHTGEICGAVTGAVILLGLKYGMNRPGDSESKQRTYDLVKQYTDLFKQKYGSIHCTDLIHYDLRIEEELNQARASGVFDTECPMLVNFSVELLESLLK